MPEGPEVHTIADWLDHVTRDHLLLDVDYCSASRYEKNGLSGQEKLRQLLPLPIINVDAQGKKIVFILGEDKDKPSCFLISSLMMEGKWQWEEENHCDLWLTLMKRGEEGKEEGDKKKNLYFKDTRHFGLLEIAFNRNELISRFKDIGPDFLIDDITDEMWLAKINNKRIKNKKIGIFLMEQKYFSGVGNYLRAEILYHARISPHRTLSSLTQEEALLILDWAIYLTRESYRLGGASLNTYRHPTGGLGGYQVIIYGKKITPDGYLVKSEDIGDHRTTYWVPTIQV